MTSFPSAEESAAELRVLLSVILAAGSADDRISRCVSRLYGQCRDSNIELILVHSCDRETVHQLESQYPQMRIVRSNKHTSLPAMLGQAIAVAKGEIIAFTDSECEVGRNWIAAMLKAHQTLTAPVIGGAVEISQVNALVGWASYFCDYGQFMLPLPGGAAREVPGNNVSIKRWALGNLAQFQENGFWKTYWCQKLEREGHLLMQTPEVIVSYEKSYSLRKYLRRRFNHGRCFAGMRGSDMPLTRRFLYIFGSMLLPLVFLVRIISSVLPKRRHLSEFALCLPVIAMAVTAWSVGEFFGYSLGAGGSCELVYVTED